MNSDDVFRYFKGGSNEIIAKYKLQEEQRESFDIFNIDRGSLVGRVTVGLKSPITSFGICCSIMRRPPFLSTCLR